MCKGHSYGGALLIDDNIYIPFEGHEDVTEYWFMDRETGDCDRDKKADVIYSNEEYEKLTIIENIKC